MSFVVVQGAVELGLVYGLVALALFVSYRILNVADLTVDGSFTLGAAVSVMFSAAGHPWLGMLIAIFAGSIAGYITAFLQTKLKVQPILAGILTMTALYSINLHVMGGKPNVNLIGKETIFTPLMNLVGKNNAKIVLIALIVLAVVILLALFLNTQLGLSIRATGDNEEMVRSSSINADFTKTVGLCIANAIVGLSGAIFAQYQGFADANMGIGMVVIGLASLIIGEILPFQRKTLVKIICVFVGAIVYRIIIAGVLQANVSPSDLKLISSVIVVIAISYPAVKEKITRAKQKRRMKHAANQPSL